MKHVKTRRKLLIVKFARAMERGDKMRSMRREARRVVTGKQ